MSDARRIEIEGDAIHRAVNALFGFAQSEWGWSSNEWHEVVSAVDVVVEALELASDITAPMTDESEPAR